MLYSTDRKRGVSLIFVYHQFFGNLLKKIIDKIRMYNKNGTRLQNKGVNLIVCLIFWTLKWFTCDTLTSPLTVSQIYFVQKIGQLTFFKLFLVTMMIEMFRELPRKVLHTFCFHINQFEMHVVWTWLRKVAFPDSERRQERRFNPKGVVMNIHRVNWGSKWISSYRHHKYHVSKWNLELMTPYTSMEWIRIV